MYRPVSSCITRVRVKNDDAGRSTYAWRRAFHAWFLLTVMWSFVGQDNSDSRRHSSELSLATTTLSTSPAGYYLAQR
jgi:hypothetical protein